MDQSPSPEMDRIRDGFNVTIAAVLGPLASIQVKGPKVERIEGGGWPRCRDMKRLITAMVLASSTLLGVAVPGHATTFDLPLERLDLDHR